MFSRRDFLKVTGLSSGFLLLNPFCSKLVNKKGGYNLLFEPSDIPELKKRFELPIFKSFWQEILNADLEDDRKFLETGIEFNNQIRHLARIDRILQREAFVYIITRDKMRGELARLAVQKILKFKKWDYFLEAGKDVIGLQRAPLTTQSLVLTFDWIGELLTDSEKEEILTQLPEKGCEPCYRSLYGMLHQDQVVGWGFDPESSFFEERDMRNWPKILSRTNLRAVPISALGLGAIFLNGRDSRADRWMEIVKKSYDDFVDLFAPDGSYPEGSGYCRYSSEELILFLEILKRQRKEDWSNSINWRGVMDFFLMTRMPSTNHPEGHVNFGDGGHGFGSDVGFWVAKTFNDGIAQYVARHQSAYHKIFSVIWYDPEVEEKKPDEKWYYRHFDIDWVVVSTGFEPEDFVLALRSGKPANHENADRNSLILKCYAENLLVDQWHPPYSHTHPAWTLRTSPAHNCVLIDGKGHQYHDGLEGTNASLAEAKIVKEKATENYVIVTSDATQAYQLVNDEVQNVNRTFLTVPELKFIIVVDILHTKQKEVEFRARWFVDNEDNKGKIEIMDNQFVLNRPLAKLIGYCECSHGVKLSKSNFPVPDEHGIFPHLDVATEKFGNKISIISAMAVLQHQEAIPIIKINKNEENWAINANIKGKEIEIIISTKDIIPELSVKLRG